MGFHKRRLLYSDTEIGPSHLPGFPPIEIKAEWVISDRGDSMDKERFRNRQNLRMLKYHCLVNIKGSNWNFV